MARKSIRPSLNLFPPEGIEGAAELHPPRRAVATHTHGNRHEWREIQVLPTESISGRWPGLQQVCRIERQRMEGDGEPTCEVAYAITSLSAAQASATDLLALDRNHWSVENCLHWVRDVVLGEDACRVRSGNAPQVLAILRNASLNRLRSTETVNGVTNAIRYHNAHPETAIDSIKSPIQHF